MRCLQAVRCSSLPQIHSVLQQPPRMGSESPVDILWNSAGLIPAVPPPLRGAGVGAGHPSAPSLQGTRRCQHHRPEGQEILRNVKNCVATETDAEPLAGDAGWGTPGETRCPRQLPWARGCFPSVCIAVITPWRLCPPPPWGTCERTRVRWPGCHHGASLVTRRPRLTHEGAFLSISWLARPAKSPCPQPSSAEGAPADAARN